MTERSAEIGDCLVWTGYCLPKGHGQVSYQGFPALVHRVAWIERNGPIPAETPQVLHHCDNPPCWAEGHLYAGTPANNMADKAGRGRHHNQLKTRCPAGHRYSKENTYPHPANRAKRACRTCAQERAREQQKRSRNG